MDIKRYIKDYILSLFEADLLGDMKYLENELIANDFIANDDSIKYKWSEFNTDVMILSIENKGIIKEYEPKRIKEIKKIAEKYAKTLDKKNN